MNALKVFFFTKPCHFIKEPCSCHGFGNETFFKPCHGVTSYTLFKNTCSGHGFVAKDVLVINLISTHASPLRSYHANSLLNQVF